MTFKMEMCQEKTLTTFGINSSEKSFVHLQIPQQMKVCKMLC